MSDDLPLKPPIPHRCPRGCRSVLTAAGRVDSDDRIWSTWLYCPKCGWRSFRTARTMSDDLPPDWRDLDGIRSYEAAIAELRRRYVAGEPVRELPMFQPRQTVAALYVETGGCYFGLPGCDPWDEARDARLYDGPWPVVAHPPCARWGRYWHGSPRKPHQYRLGDDKGCFAAALAAARRFGGVIEHPAYSKAWKAFRIPHPAHDGGWLLTSDGWTAHVEQGHYGHMARKATWLLYCGGAKPPELKWGPAPQRLSEYAVERYGYEYARRAGVMSYIGGKDKSAIRARTPERFRDLLLSIARSASPLAQRPAGGDKPATEETSK